MPASPPVSWRKNARRCCAIFFPPDGRRPDMPRIQISLAAQTLDLLNEQGRLLCRYSVSTSRNGPGEFNDSFCTPRGKHIIRVKIGAGTAENTIFVGRRPTGEV